MISQKLTNQAKKQQALYRQLYGKEKLDAKTASYTLDLKSIAPTLKAVSGVKEGDLGYLKKDLFKILFLAVFVFTVQLLIYFQLKTNLLQNLLTR